MRVGGRGQPRHAPAHAEAGNSDAVALYRIVIAKPGYGGVDVGDNVGVAEQGGGTRTGAAGGGFGNGCRAVAVIQAGGNGGIALGGQAVANILYELVHAGSVLGDEDGRVGRAEAGAAVGHAGVHRQVQPVDGNRFPKTCHSNLSIFRGVRSGQSVSGSFPLRPASERLLSSHAVLHIQFNIDVTAMVISAAPKVAASGTVVKPARG